MVCPPDQIARLPELLGRLVAEPEQRAAEIRAYRDRSVYNVESSAPAGAQWLIDALAKSGASS